MTNKILIACEESQTVAKEFRRLGFDAYSCDIQLPSGGHPEFHIQGDAIEQAYSGEYKMMIAFPPCTYLSTSGNRHLYNKDGSKNADRWERRHVALEFVRKLMDAPIDYIAIENPVSVISSQIRKPDQIIQPYYFGDRAKKTTCLWLKNLPKLIPTDIVDAGEFRDTRRPDGSGYVMPLWYYDAVKNARSYEERRKLRSKTFEGIARAMATQWGKHIVKQSDSFGDLFDMIDRIEGDRNEI